MLLDRHDTSSLNHLIARQIGCNSSKIRAQTILCRSISRESIKYDLVDSTFKIINNNNHNNNNNNNHNNNDNTNNITGWFQQPTIHGSGHNQDATPGTEAISATAASTATTTTSPVYHIFYSTEYSDSIIYIMAILCIYFVLFSLLIYANWTSFHHQRGGGLHQNNSKRRRRQKLSQQQQLCKRNGTYLFQQPGTTITMVQICDKNATTFKATNMISLCWQKIIKGSPLGRFISANTPKMTIKAADSLEDSNEMDQFI